MTTSNITEQKNHCIYHYFRISYY